MPSCTHCHREFATEFAKNGHLRACSSKPHAHGTQPVGNSTVGSAAEPGSANSVSAEIRLPRRSAHAAKYLRRLIRAFDLASGLRKWVHERLWMYKLCCNRVGQEGPTFEDWCQVTTDLLRCERELGELVQRSSVSRDRLWAVYVTVIDVQERWLPWAEQEVERIWEKREKRDDTATLEDKAREYGLPRLNDQFHQLAELLRELTAMTRMGI